jgi:hypothetical protein
MIIDTNSCGLHVWSKSSTKLPVSYIYQQLLRPLVLNSTNMALSLDSLPKLQRATIANDKLTYDVRDDAPMLVLTVGRALMETVTVGLSPVDTKMIGPFVTAGASYGVCPQHFARI